MEYFGLRKWHRVVGRIGKLVTEYYHVFSIFQYYYRKVAEKVANLSIIKILEGTAVGTFSNENADLFGGGTITPAPLPGRLAGMGVGITHSNVSGVFRYAAPQCWEALNAAQRSALKSPSKFLRVFKSYGLIFDPFPTRKSRRENYRAVGGVINDK